VESNKTGPLQIGLGFLNRAGAMSTNYQRGNFGSAPDTAEFDYYTRGYYVDGGTTFPADPATFPSFISGVYSFDYDPIIVSVYDNELPTNQTIHVSFSYSSERQMTTLVVKTNGVVTTPLPPLPLDPAHGFQDTDDVLVDMFSISSYSSVGDDFDSVLANGTVSNVVVSYQFKPVGGFTGATIADGVWKAHFYGHTNYNYALERSGDLQSWIAATEPLGGTKGGMVLVDTFAPPDKAFYRVKAQLSGP
jgi:hypothetical protein